MSSTTPTQTPIKQFHQTPHLIIKIFLFLPQTLSQLLTASKISRTWYALLGGGGGFSHDCGDDDDGENPHQTKFILDLWRRVLADAIAMGSSTLQQEENDDGNLHPLMPIGCALDSNVDYLMRKLYFTHTSSQIVTTANNPASLPPKVIAAIDFCLATDDVFHLQLLSSQTDGDGDDNDQNLTFNLIDPKEHDRRRKEPEVKFLGNKSKCIIPSTEIMRFKFFRDEKVVGEYDIRLRRHQEEENSSNSSRDGTLFPCWNISKEILEQEQKNDLFKVLRHASVDVMLSDEEREDPDVVLFDRMEAFFVKSFYREMMMKSVRRENDDDLKNVRHQQQPEVKLCCCVLTSKNADSKKNNKLMNYIKFSMEELEEQGKNEGRNGFVQMMSVM